MSHTVDTPLLALAMNCVDEAKGNAHRAKIALSQNIYASNDLDLLRAFSKPYYSNCLDTHIQAALREHRKAGKYGITKIASGASGSGRNGGGGGGTVDRGANGGGSEPGVFVVGGGQPTGTGDGQIGVGVDNPKYVPTGSADRWQRKEQAIRKSWLDKFLVNGKILRLCTALEVREYMAYHQRANDFLGRVVNGMLDDQVIGDCVADDEADTYALQAGLDRRH